jgi:hypothetical protein
VVFFCVALVASSLNFSNTCRTDFHM